MNNIHSFDNTRRINGVDSFTKILDNVSYAVTMRKEKIGGRFSFVGYPVLILYGCGDTGIRFCDFLYESGFLSSKVVYFVDKDKSKQGKIITRGLYCYPPEKIFNEREDYIVIITSKKYYNEIYSELRKEENSCEKGVTLHDDSIFKIIYDLGIRLCYIKRFSEDQYITNQLKNKKKIVELYQCLYDEQSRETLLYDWQKHLTGDAFIDYSPQDCSVLKNRDFVPQFIQNNIMDDTVALCCGAFLLNSNDILMKWITERFKKSVIYEINRSYMEHIASVLKNQRIQLYNLCWGEKKERKQVSNSNSEGELLCYNFCSDGFIDIDALDKIVAKDVEKDTVGLIFINLRNATIPALKGMKHTLKKHSPTIAINIYCDFLKEQENVYDIADYLRAIVPGYLFSLRHFYHPYINELHRIVLYAFVPKGTMD